MTVKQLKQDLYYIGVFNPNLRVFDIVMKTDFGTTYNSYLVSGKEKTAIVECCHADFFEEYLENVQGILGDKQPDYVILNHTEPDHSGGLKKLIAQFPNIQIIASQAGSIYLKNIVNEPLNMTVVKDGDTIDLGGKTLKFVSAPFLHWPDSMFTYCPEDKVAFTCDFLGCHHCELNIFADKVKDIPQYEHSLQYYYGAIFGPFAQYVRAGLDKLKVLEFDMALTSHGPVLRGKELSRAISLYTEWSAQECKLAKRIGVYYCSAYGCTKQVGQAICTGITEVLGGTGEIDFVELDEHNLPSINVNGLDGLLVGSPTINKDAVPHIWHILGHVDAINSKNITASAFGSYGWSGEAVPNMMGRLKMLKFKTLDEGFKVILIPSEEELEQAKEFGRAFAASL